MGITLGFSFFELQNVSSKVKSIVEKAIESNQKLKEQNDQLKAQLEAQSTRTDSSTPSAETQQEIPLVTIAKGSVSGVTEPKNLVIRNSQEFEEIWNEIYSIRPAMPPVPEIDFAKADVLAAFNGEKPNLCYDITIDRIDTVPSHLEHDEGGFEERLVVVTKTEPDEGAVCGQLITQAYHLVAVPSWPFEVTFSVWTEKIK